MEETMLRRVWRFYSGGGLTERDRRSSRKVNLWALVWMSCWVGVGLLISRELVPPGAASYAAVLVTTALGVGTLLAYVKFLREAEELERKIQLDALALGFGVGLVAIVLWSMLAELGAVEGDPAHLLFFMMFPYCLGLWLGFRRYS